MLKRRLQEPFGKAGLTVAVIALVMALVGGAYAAGGLTKSQEKQVKKIAKKYAGKPGAPGTAGTNGTNGTNGKDGAAGVKGEQGIPGVQGNAGTNGKTVLHGAAAPSNATGTEGDFYIATNNDEIYGPKTTVWGSGTKLKGEEGSPWTVGGTLPQGETEKGEWAVVSQGITAAGAISFNIPLASAPSVHYINENNKELTGSGEQTSTVCTGTAASPIASEGALCVYAASESGASTNFALNEFFHPGWKWGVVVYEGGGSIVGNTAKPFGAVVSVVSEGEEEVINFTGSWAVKGS